MPEDEVLDSSAGSDVRTEAELDKLADSTEKATNRERPMEASQEKTAPTKEEESYEFSHSGKTVKGTREQILKWAQMGYDRPQFAQKLNQEKLKWDEDRKKWESQWGIYKQIDDFAKSNQDWWNTVQNAWKTRQNPQGQPAQGMESQQPEVLHPKLQLLEQKLSQLEPVVQQFLQKEEQLKVQAQDQQLDQEVKSIREQHSDLDWNLLDENGKSLELRVLEHAQQNGIPSFRAAFRDLLHDQLLTKAQSMGKLAVAKGVQNRTKLGVLGETPTPTRGMPRSNKDIRKTSYEDLEQEAKEEVRQLQFRK